MPEISDLRFNAVAYFYKLKDGESISIMDVQTMMKEVTSSKIHNYLFDKIRQNGGNETLYSLRVFKELPKAPTFLHHINDNNWKEQKIGYFLFVEYLNYVAVLKRNCTIPKFISQKLQSIEYDKLIALYTNNDTQIKKLSMRNMDGSNHAMRYKSYESENLKENVSPIGSGRYYLRSVKGVNSNNSFSLTLFSSRINDYASAYTVMDICDWAKKTIENIIAVHDINSSFLNIFAKPEKYADKYKALVPSSVLMFYGLIANLHDKLGCSFYHEGNQEKRLINDGTFNRYLQLLSTSYNVQSVNNHYYIGHNNCIEVVMLKSGIKLHNKNWDNIIVEDSPNGEYDGTLSELINKYSLFNVYFTDTELVYNNKTLFRDTKLLSSSVHFLEVLKGNIVEDLTCEKYHDQSPQTLNDWANDSIFKYVETNFITEYSYFICDDCGDEWADHIGIATDRVTFFVEKHRKSKDSASDFQDVVAQALKNISNLIPSDAQLDAKRDTWNGLYLTSNIQRLRKGNNIDDVIAEWKKNNLRPNCRREMCLVVDFLSKNNYEDQLRTIQNGRPIAHESELRQRLWLLSSFVNSCLEYGVVPLIYCKA